MKKTQTTIFQKLQLLRRSIKQLRQTTTNSKKSSLILRIKRLFRQLNGWTNFAKLKPGIVASMIAVGFSFGPQTVSGQNYFAEPVTGAFGVSSIEIDGIYIYMPSFADLDDDGDLDLLVSGLSSSYYDEEQQYLYYENKGDASTPNFTGPKNNLFGLGVSLGGYGVGFPGTFVDLDNDGDFDVLSSAVTYNPITEQLFALFSFQENIGTKEAPSFAEAVANPFNLNFGDTESYFNTISTVDLDSDGDMDIIVNTNFEYFSQVLYFENTGSGGEISFENPIDMGTTILNLQQSEEYLLNSSFADMDNDGDEDLMIGIYAEDLITGNETFFARYYENISDGEIKFKDPVDSPFNLQESDDDFILPVIVDIDNDGDFDIFSFGYAEPPNDDDFLDLYFYENLDADVAPIAENSSLDMNEDEVYSFVEADFAYSDGNSDPLLKILIKTLPKNGVLKFKGSDATETLEISTDELNELTYTPRENEFGENYDSFTVNVISGPSENEAQTSGNDGTITINVLAVPDAPTFDLGENEFTDCTQGQTVNFDILNINAVDANVDSLRIEATTDNEDLVTNLTVDYENPADNASVSFIPESNGTGTANIMVTLTDGELSFTENYLFTVGDCLGIDDIVERATFNLAPNPANDFVKITLEDDFITENTLVNIYDLKGKLLLQQPLNKNTIDVSDLVSGVYVLVVNHKDVNHYRKLIIER